MLTSIKRRSAQLNHLVSRLPNVPRTLLVHTVKGGLLMAVCGLGLAAIAPDPVSKAFFLQTVVPCGVTPGFLSGIGACLKVYPQTMFSRLVRVLLTALMVLLAILSFGMLSGMIGVAAGKRF